MEILRRKNRSSSIQIFTRIRIFKKILSELSSKEVLFHPLALAMQQRVSQLYDQIIIGEPSFKVDTESIQASSLEDALDVLWQDPDPDTAGWVLMAQRVFNDKIINLNAIEKRSGLSTSLFLDCQMQGQIHRDHDEFPYLCRSPFQRSSTCGPSVGC